MNCDNNICDCPEKIRELCQCKKCSGEDKLFDQFHRYSVIMASAGTGKTYNLAMRYLQLLSFGISPDEILAVTFTRKAAGEIFDKIVNRLLEMLKTPHCCHLTSDGKLRKILQQLLDGENELRISTIDSFFSSLLQAFAPELGIRNDIQMIDANDTKYRKKVIRQWLRAASDKEMDELREWIKEANNDKQSSFESAINKLLDDVYGIYLEHSKNDDFTENRWGADFESEKKFRIPDPKRFNELGEYFDIYNKQLSDKTANRRFGELAKFLKNGAVGSVHSDVTALLGKLTENNSPTWLWEVGDLVYLKKNILGEEVAKHVREAFRMIIAAQLEQAKKKSRAIFSLMQKFDAIYEKEVRGNGILTFQDLPYILRQGSDDSGFHLASSENINIEERLDASINHYLFDEFQDTSDTQWYILENLISELFVSLDDRFRSFFCVGDIKQSIYQWRGGNPELFGKVKDMTTQIAEELGYSPCKSLFESYRSSQDILNTSNIIFNDLRPDAPELFKLSVQKMQYGEHTSKKENLSGFSTLISIDKKADELEVKAKMILDVIKKADPFAPGKNLTVGVLQHDNKGMRALADRLQEVAERENISLAVSIDGNLSPQDSMAYSFLKQLLILANHPADKKARTFLSMLTFGSIENPEPFSADKIAERLGFENVSDLEQLSRAVRNDIFLNETSGFVRRFFNAFKCDLNSFDRSRISAVAMMAEGYNGNTDEFLNDIETWLKAQDQSVKQTVQFMTIHKSKGLEFDIVFIPDSDVNHKPSTIPEIAKEQEICNGVRWINYLPVKSIQQYLPEMEKHMRIVDEANAFAQCCKYYVALTRAKRAMYLFFKLPENPNTFRFEVEITKQLERFAPEDMHKVSFSDMQKRCELENQVNLVYASGTENWYDTVAVKKTPPPQEVPDTKVKLVYPSKSRRLASLEDGGFISVAPEVRFSAYSATDTGTELHDLFEKIDFIDKDFNAEEFLRENASEELSSTAKEIFMTAIDKNTPIRAALANPDTKCTLWKERRFLLQDDDGATIPGAFDRVVMYLDGNGNPCRAEILDYKSDKVESGSELVKRHRKQLELYRKCLSRMTAIPEAEIKISLAWLRAGKIVEII